MKPKKPIDSERVKEVAKTTTCTNHYQVYQVLAEELGVSRETFRKRLNEEGNDLAVELEKIYEENTMGFGFRSKKKLEKILDIEYDEMDHDGQRIHIAVATEALKRTDKLFERKSKMRELEADKKALMEENEHLKKKIGKITDGSTATMSAYVLPVYIIETNNSYYDALAKSQIALQERAREVCRIDEH